MKRQIGDAVGVRPIIHGPMYKATLSKPPKAKKTDKDKTADDVDDSNEAGDKTIFEVTVSGEKNGVRKTAGELLDYEPPHSVDSNVLFFLPKAGKAGRWQEGKIEDILPDCSYLIDAGSPLAPDLVRIQAEQVALNVGAPVEFSTTFTSSSMLGLVRQVHSSADRVTYDIELVRRKQKLGFKELVGEWQGDGTKVRVDSAHGYVRVCFLSLTPLKYELMRTVGDTLEFGEIGQKAVGSTTQEWEVWQFQVGSSSLTRSVWSRGVAARTSSTGDSGTTTSEGGDSFRESVTWFRPPSDETLLHSKDDLMSMLQTGRIVRGVHHMQLRGIVGTETMSSYRSLAYSSALSIRTIHQSIYNAVYALPRDESLAVNPFAQCVSEEDSETQNKQLLACSGDRRFVVSSPYTKGKSAVDLAAKMLARAKSETARQTEREEKMGSKEFYEALNAALGCIDEFPVSVDASDAASGVFGLASSIAEGKSRPETDDGPSGPPPGRPAADETDTSKGAATKRYIHAQHLYEVNLATSKASAQSGEDKESTSGWKCNGRIGQRPCGKVNRPREEIHYTCSRGSDFNLCESCFKNGVVPADDTQGRSLKLGDALPTGTFVVESNNDASRLLSKVWRSSWQQCEHARNAKAHLVNRSVQFEDITEGCSLVCANRDGSCDVHVPFHGIYRHRRSWTTQTTLAPAFARAVAHSRTHWHPQHATADTNSCPHVLRFQPAPAPSPNSRTGTRSCLLLLQVHGDRTRA